MRKFISTVIATLVLTEVHSRTPGWFYSVRGGTGLLPKMYPDALTSVVHGCAELDSKTDAKQNEVQHVKSSGATKKKVVKTVSHERVDNELFEKLNDKLFHHDHGDHHGRNEEKPAAAKISYGAREFLLEDDLFE
eukprot:CAMPEP_0201686092 /NCGR_PEP_ID=MMETSP0578-20130828/657_1 /ASSEMBLY_ACC=CAM_ASM_000663 /TAXON_ID=267565 /ORGANISM="Skeletonema grethea, Strain CCMP 1804" /LENGTH=134 /DNA_ID=CAMNT_0048170091 /DNA_START=129 /DNA_END=533 /DNA_ORIENTATION=-